MVNNRVNPGIKKRQFHDYVIESKFVLSENISRAALVIRRPDLSTKKDFMKSFDVL